MPRKGGLGPQGHAAVARAATTLNTRPASVQDPEEFTSPLEAGNPAALSQQTNEAETVPSNWWIPPRGSRPAVALERFGGPSKSTRINEAGYDPGSQRLYVRFQQGQVPWTYEGVPPTVWRNFRRSTSPGKFVNRVLNNYDYHRGEWT
jgi:hypothetical protein